MRKTLFLLLIALTGAMLSSASAQSVSVIITEKTINDFLAAMGPVKGKGQGARRIKYSWTVTSPTIDFEPGTAGFMANIKVKTKIITLTDKVKGRLKIDYDARTNKIKMQVVEAKFPVYINVFGTKVKLATLDIGKYYKPKFEFNGPEPVQKTVQVDIGGDAPINIGVTVSGREIRMEKDQLRVSVRLSYAAL
ncbi:MAG: hypothetical protein IIA60_04990 [Candidatus Marinimicrobia bacterium]|nr:hypothetical protein [Candidatus Neomarinimicrobiota bacterium]